MPDEIAPHTLTLVPTKNGRPRGRGPKPYAPRDKKVFKTAMAIIALRAQGQTQQEIGEVLGITRNTVQTYLARANKLGYLKMADFDQPNDQIDVILRSKVVRNVDTLLDARDKDTTLKVFEMLNPPVKNDAPIQQTAMVLQVRVDMPPPPVQNPMLPPVVSEGISIREGTIGGAMASGIPIDAEIVG